MDDGMLPEDDGEGKTGMPREKLIRLIALPCVIVLLLGMIAIFVSVQMKASREAKRGVAEQVLGVLSLKWELEAEGVKICEEGFKLLRAEENAEHLAKLPFEPKDRDEYLRVWVYEKKRTLDLIDKTDKFLGSLDYKSNQLLQDMVSGTAIRVVDIAIDWLTYRGYKIVENLKKNPGLAGASTLSISSGGKVNSRPPGGVRMRMFGVNVEADFDPDQSYVDTDSGFIRAVFQTNYSHLYPSAGGPPGTVTVSAAREYTDYTLNLAEEIADFYQNSGFWCSQAFDRSSPSNPTGGGGN